MISFSELYFNTFFPLKTKNPRYYRGVDIWHFYLVWQVVTAAPMLYVIINALGLDLL